MTPMSPPNSQRICRHAPHGGVGLRRVGDDGDAAELAVASDKRREHRDALGADVSP